MTTARPTDYLVSLVREFGRVGTTLCTRGLKPRGQIKPCPPYPSELAEMEETGDELVEVTA